MSMEEEKDIQIHVISLQEDEDKIETWKEAYQKGKATTVEYIITSSLLRTSSEELITNLLHKTTDGDIIVCHHNQSKNLTAAYFAENLRDYALGAMSLTTDFFMPFYEFVAHRCSHEVLQFLIPEDIELRKKIAYAPLGSESVIILRVNEKTRKFMDLVKRSIQDNSWFFSSQNKTPYASGLRFVNEPSLGEVLTVLAYREKLFHLDYHRGTTWIEHFRNSVYEVGYGVDRMLKVRNLVSIQKIIGADLESVKQNKWKHAIVIQGPFHLDLTRKIIRLFLERNPETLIIVSTTTSADEYRHGDMIPRVVYIILEPPIREFHPDFWSTNLMNQNLQRYTSYVGINFAKQLGISFVLKIRSDAILGKRNICFHLQELCKTPPLILSENYKLRYPLKGRIIVSNRSCKYEDRWDKNQDVGRFFIGDQYYFGATEDLLNFFDLSHSSAWDGGRGISIATPPENNLMLCWMKNLGIPSDNTDLKEITARYMSVVNALDVEFACFKNYSYDDYISGGLTYLQRKYAEDLRVWPFFLSTREWETWVEKFSQNRTPTFQS